MQFVGTFWALVPPIIAITLALITKEAYSSLFIGVVIGALFACDFAPVATIDMIVNDGIIAAIADNAGIFLFLVLLGIIVALVKALVFGLIISLISCREGLNTRNGAVGVGKSTMQAMVYASVALLIANFILTMILNSIFPMGFMR